MSESIRPTENASEPTTGEEIIRGLKGLRDALASGVRLPDRFTMRTIELELEPRDWTPDDIRALRERLHASQAVFAKLIGASIKTVQAWEQGNAPPPMARRLLECIQQNPEPWERILHEAAVAKSAE
ncbi:MAG TPA: hypothetical protein PLU35_13215 [Phycisphaerales bacterium]|nr:hypothetical protein [Phycisphaeraceae bacterium]HRQ73979.1 hypothetical protein [Phycisphaerales bacterium]